jgi:hypothetical protein
MTTPCPSLCQGEGEGEVYVTVLKVKIILKKVGTK